MAAHASTDAAAVRASTATHHVVVPPGAQPDSVDSLAAEPALAEGDDSYALGAPAVPDAGHGAMLSGSGDGHEGSDGDRKPAGATPPAASADMPPSAADVQEQQDGDNGDLATDILNV
jgi:hypothetical protein